MQTFSIKWNYSSNYAGVFLYKSSSHTKHNWHCIIGFLINAGLLNVCFTLHYHLLFCKEIHFFECLYFSEYGIRMPLYGFWLRKGPSIMYVRSCWGDGGSFKLCTVADRVMGCHASWVCTNIWTFQIVIAKNLNITCIFNQRNLFNRLTHSFLSSIFEFSYKSGIQMFV